MRSGHFHFLGRFVWDRAAATAAEFALVVPLLLLFLFGIIDVGRFMWEVNRAEKATQMGVRFAAVTNMVPNVLGTTDFALTVTQGSPVPLASFEGTRCRAGACSNAVPTASCTSGASGSWGYDGVAFNLITDRMMAMYPLITANNVEIDYTNSGLGFAGDPNGSDVSPLITVRLCGMQFTPITTQIFGLNTPMPSVASSLTMEDGAGTVSN